MNVFVFECVGVKIFSFFSMVQKHIPIIYLRSHTHKFFSCFHSEKKSWKGKGEKSLKTYSMQVKFGVIISSTQQVYVQMVIDFFRHNLICAMSPLVGIWNLCFMYWQIYAILMLVFFEFCTVERSVTKKRGFETTNTSTVCPTLGVHAFLSLIRT
jgi:hypothetical protein